MDNDPATLYQALGYQEATSDAHSFDMQAAGAAQADNFTPLNAEQVTALRKMMEENPDEVLRWYRDTWGDHITEEDLWQTLTEAEMALAHPEEAAAAIASFDLFRSKPRLPEGFKFDGMDLAAIPIDPGIRKFETRGDALGWVLFAGPKFIQDKLKGVERVPFRWHSDAQSDFVYELANPPANGKSTSLCSATLAPVSTIQDTLPNS